MSAVIDVHNLNFSFSHDALALPVLKNITIAIDKGEIVIMTGPSGSGKTTFLTIVGGLRQAHDGSVEVLGRQLINSSECTKVGIRQQTGYIFQLLIPV